MFTDTAAPVDARIRAVRQYAKPALDMRHAAQTSMRAHRADPQATTLLARTRTQSLGASMHLSTQTFPLDADAIRARTNADIHRHERDMKGCVHALRSLQTETAQGLIDLRPV